MYREKRLVNDIVSVTNRLNFVIRVTVSCSSQACGMVRHDPEIVKDGDAVPVAKGAVGWYDSSSSHASRKAPREVKGRVQFAV